jgi:hypothetical protein
MRLRVKKRKMLDKYYVLVYNTFGIIKEGKPALRGYVNRRRVSL